MRDFEILPDHLRDPSRRSSRALGAHILTGPIAVEGAEPGDVLEIQILAIDPRQNWGYTRIRPLAGTLPEDFPIRQMLAHARSTASAASRPCRGGRRSSWRRSSG